MPLPSMPAIDANVCGDWTENNINAYQALPHYLAKVMVDMKKTFPTFSRLTKKRKWTQNMGPVLRGVRTNPSPHMRQFANPTLVTSPPKVDVMNIAESFTEASVRWHDFESPIFNWYPSFNAFMDHIDDNGKDIAQKIERFNEVFIRGMMFHQCPFVFIALADGTVKLVNAPYWSGSGTFDGGVNQGKTAAFLAANLPTGNLKLSAIEMACTISEVDLRMPFFSGSEIPSEDKPLDGKFLTILDTEAWNQLIYDPLATKNRAITFDLLTNGYRGSFFGRTVSRLEDLPLRYKLDGTFVAPELRVGDDENNAGETVPNPDYSDPKNSPVGVAWISGPSGYESIETGPPPSLFTGNTFPNSPKMDWSGVPKLTKNFLLFCVDSNGNVQPQANTYGKYLKFIAEQTFGILSTQRRNAIPILYLRKRGVA